MIAACYLSMRRGYLKKEEYKSVIDLLRLYHMPTVASGLSVEDVLLATKSDKKMDNDHVKFILLDRIGNAFIETGLRDDELREAICVVVEDNA